MSFPSKNNNCTNGASQASVHGDLRLQRHLLRLHRISRELEEIRRALGLLGEKAARNGEIRRDGGTQRDLALLRQLSGVEEMRQELVLIQQEEAEREVEEIRRALALLWEEEVVGEGVGGAMSERRDSMVLEQGQSMWIGHVQDGSMLVDRETEEDAEVQEEEHDEMNIFEWMEDFEAEVDAEEDEGFTPEQDEDSDEEEVSRGMKDMET